MRISIIKPKGDKEINFNVNNNTESLSLWVTFEFKILEDIDKTGLLFFLTTNIEDFYFRNRNGSDSKKFRFGSRKSIKANQVLKKRIRFYCSNSVSNSMLFTVRLYSCLYEELREHKVIVKVKKIENGI